MPDKNHHSIEAFKNLVEKDINNSTNEPQKQPKQNLTKGELQALKQL